MSGCSMSHFDFDISLTAVDHARVGILAVVGVGAIHESHALLKVLIGVIDAHQLLGLVRELKEALTSELIVVGIRLLQNLKPN